MRLDGVRGTGAATTNAFDPHFRFPQVSRVIGGHAFVHMAVRECAIRRRRAAHAVAKIPTASSGTAAVASTEPLAPVNGSSPSLDRPEPPAGELPAALAPGTTAPGVAPPGVGPGSAPGASTSGMYSTVADCPRS
jgi:hypothetical protein